MNRKKKTNKKYKIIFIVLVSSGLALLAALALRASDAAVLDPKGHIAKEQFDLIVFTALLSLIVIIPVFTLTFYIVWKYREDNKKAKYSPAWDRSRAAEATWWLIPLALISILAVVTWKSTHDLDPYKPIASDTKPITIQVVALEWKWLFLYPEQGIATVNYVQFPEDTPVNFVITADAPMNSFWIPQLGGQVYAMAGMQTKLHLMADTVGSFNGSSANLSGEGFSGMRFIARASSEADFTRWAKKTKQSPNKLTLDAYNKLTKPTKNHPQASYALVEEDLHTTIMMKYMQPGDQHGANDSKEHGTHAQ